MKVGLKGGDLVKLDININNYKFWLVLLLEKVAHDSILLFFMIIVCFNIKPLWFISNSSYHTI